MYDVVLLDSINYGRQDNGSTEHLAYALSSQIKDIDKLSRKDIIDFSSAHWSIRGVGVVRLRTFLEKLGYKVKVIFYTDYMSMKTLDNLLSKFITKETKILGASTNWQSTFLNLDIIDNFFAKQKEKHPNLKITLGGHNAENFKEMESIDRFVVGYGENAMLSILTGETEKYMDGTFKYKFPSEYNALWKEEDGLVSSDMVPLEIARGCIFQCSYCSFPLVGKKKNDHIGKFEDLEYILNRNYEKFGLTRYIVSEETFNDNPWKMEELLKVIEKLPFKFKFSCYIRPELLVAKPETIDLLVALGLEGSQFGIETLNNESRKAIHKGYDYYEKIGPALSQLKQKALKNIPTYNNWFNLIVGLPYEDEKTIETHYNYILNAYEVDGVAVQPLIIRQDASGLITSPIDRDPAAFGYTFSEKTDKRVAQWVNNKGMTFNDANSITAHWMTKFGKIQRIGGMNMQGLLSCGLNLEDFYKKQGGYYNNLSIFDVKNLTHRFFKRVDSYVEQQLSL